LRRDLWLDWPIARPLRIKAKRRTGIARFIRRGRRLPRLHRRGPFEDSLRALATKTRIGRHVGAWWRRPRASDESRISRRLKFLILFAVGSLLFIRPELQSDSRGDHTDACHIIPPGQRDLGRGPRERTSIKQTDDLEPRLLFME